MTFSDLQPLRIACLLCLAITAQAEVAEEESAGAQLDVNIEQDHLAEISRLEALEGAYHPQLVDRLGQLGAWYQQQGEMLQAVDTLERALHVSKVNHGLENFSQAAIVEQLIESYSKLRDWKKLAEKLHYLLWLHRRNLENNDDRLLAIMQRVGNWYREAYYFHEGGEALAFLVQADDLVDESIALVEAHSGSQARQLTGLRHLSSTINAQIARDVKDVFKMSHRDIRRAMIPNNRGNPYMNEIAVREYYFEQSFYKGRRALQKVIDAHQAGLPDTAVDYAQALAYQGDFYLSLNRKWNAMKNYNLAYDTLLEHGAEEAEILAIFGEPVRVKPFTIPGYELSDAPGHRFVEVLFDVPSNGWPTNIRVIASEPIADSKLQARGKRVLSATRYRPRFERGKPVASENISLKHQFRK